MSVEPGRAVVVCHVPRRAGAGAALGLADRVAARFRGRSIGSLRFDTPAIDLDGRDPAGFRAVVVLPFRRHGAG
ncbi:hypothetical protein [Thalassobaculum sp.]|uniref:hypothetical protein n=1 Tax=Thalassobaculum sp. TaxID=2022740 RepID=UPI0032ECD668